MVGYFGSVGFLENFILEAPSTLITESPIVH